MGTPLGDIGKPAAEGYRKGRKVFLVPLFTAPRPPVTEEEEDGEHAGANSAEASSAERELNDLLARYWSGVEEHIARLETTLSKVSRLYHESLVVGGDVGDKLLEQLNPFGFTLMRNRILSGAELEATENPELAAEAADWRACLSLGLVSQKAGSTVYESYMDVTNRRYEHIAAQIDRTLKEDESAILIIGDNHRVQFPADIQVFYVAPPALDELRKWIDDQMRRMTSSAR